MLTRSSALIWCWLRWKLFCLKIRLISAIANSLNKLFCLHISTFPRSKIFPWISLNCESCLKILTKIVMTNDSIFEANLWIPSLNVKKQQHFALKKAPRVQIEFQCGNAIPIIFKWRNSCNQIFSKNFSYIQVKHKNKSDKALFACKRNTPLFACNPTRDMWCWVEYSCMFPWSQTFFRQMCGNAGLLSRRITLYLASLQQQDSVAVQNESHRRISKVDFKNDNNYDVSDLT